MAEESSGEKVFDPTPKRRADAAKQGDTLRSREVATAAALATGAGVLALIAPWFAESIAGIARLAFRFDKGELDAFTPGAMLSGAAAALLPPIAVLGLAAAGMTLAVQLLLGDGRFVLGNLAFKGSRINPLAGLKRMVGLNALIELGKGLVKVALLGAIAWGWARGELAALLGMGAGDLGAQIGYGIDAFAELMGFLLLGLIAIALIDYPLQMFQRNKRLKMSLQELRDETKQSEGSPEMKSARRQRQRALARGGVAKAMRDAQFVIVNPLHFAVALTYDPARAPAPLLLAKGRGEIALAMREIAAEAGLPVLEYPTLARAVYFTTRENQMVREELYVALAALVAFVMALKRGDRPHRPAIEVPRALQFDGDGRLTPAPASRS